MYTFHLTHITSVESVVKTEDQNEPAIDMYENAFHIILQRDFSAVQKANESEAVRVTEEPDETDSDASTEIDEDYSPPATAFSGQ